VRWKLKSRAHGTRGRACVYFGAGRGSQFDLFCGPAIPWSRGPDWAGQGALAAPLCLVRKLAIAVSMASAHGVTISMDGEGRCMDNIFVERLWRSLKYEEVYLNAYATVAEAKAGIGCWLEFCNTERQHQSLGYRTPRQIYQEGLWICGRSALPTGCASPASRASSEGEETLTFAHIPTGTTVNKAMHIDDSKSRSVAPAAAPTMIGADVETGGATP
jgi:hypothetical protein